MIRLYFADCQYTIIEIAKEMVQKTDLCRNFFFILQNQYSVVNDPTRLTPATTHAVACIICTCFRVYNADVSTFPLSVRRCNAFMVESAALWKIGENKRSLVYAYTSCDICRDAVYVSAVRAPPARGSLNTE